MKEKIESEEIKHFEFIYNHLRDNFPKVCSCGKRYEHELDYNENTYYVEGLTNGLEIDILAFHRNCPNCKTTYTLDLSEEEDTRKEWQNFVKYTFNRAEREGKDFDDVSMDIRQEYNEIFLPRKWAEEQMLRNPELYGDLEYHLNAPMRRRF